MTQEARAAGANIVREPAATFWGGYSAAFTDPDGHPWEVAYNPRWRIRDDGSIELPDQPSAVTRQRGVRLTNRQSPGLPIRWVKVGLAHEHSGQDGGEGLSEPAPTL